jgi:hypothetical protein
VGTAHPTTLQFSIQPDLLDWLQRSTHPALRAPLRGGDFL